MIDIEKIFLDVKEKFKHHPARFEHIIGVTKTAVSLAIRNNVDSNKAYLAALFHDYTKYDDIETQKSFLSEKEINLYQDFPVMYHALSAASILKQKYQIDDEELLNAIRYHVWGRVGMTILDKIILVADKTEPTRVYESVEKLRKLSQHSLDQTIKVYLEEVQILNLKKGFKNPEVMNEIIKALGV